MRLEEATRSQSEQAKRALAESQETGEDPYKIAMRMTKAAAALVKADDAPLKRAERFGNDVSHMTKSIWNRQHPVVLSR